MTPPVNKSKRRERGDAKEVLKTNDIGTGEKTKEKNEE
jgi:hypothetical protein